MGITFGSPEAQAIRQADEQLERQAIIAEAREAAIADGTLKRYRVSATYRVEWEVEVDATDSSDAERAFYEEAEHGDILDAFDGVQLDQPDFISVRAM